MEKTEKNRAEFMEYYNEVLTEAAREWDKHANYNNSIRVTRIEFYSAKEQPEGAVNVLLKARADYLKGMKSLLSRSWVEHFNLCDIGEEKLRELIFERYLIMREQQAEYADDSTMVKFLESFYRGQITLFFYDYQNITQYNKWIKEASPKELPKGLFTPKQEKEFLRIEALLIDNKILTPELRWLRQGDHQSLCYLLLNLCRHNIFRHINPNDEDQESFKELLPIIQRWEYDYTDKLQSGGYLKASKFKNIQPKYIKGKPLDFKFLHINPM